MWNYLTDRDKLVSITQNTKPLIVRNLTAQCLTIISAERRCTASEHEHRNDHLLKATRPHVFDDASGYFCRVKEESAAGTTKRDVHIRIAPFMTYQTDIAIPHPTYNEILLITFASENDDGTAHEWRLALPPPLPPATPPRTVPLTPATTPPPIPALSSIYFPTTPFLALLAPPSDPRTWMSAFHPSTPLAALSLPGTHNSATHHRALPSVRCQAAPIAAQLARGVRFLDVRVQTPTTAWTRASCANGADDVRCSSRTSELVEGAADDDNGNEASRLLLVHGAFPVALTGARTLRALLDDVMGFLTAHPSETVVMSLKREGRPTGSDAVLAEMLRGDVVARAAELWWTEPRVPTLGEARGRIVLMRRFALPSAWCAKGVEFGLDAERWRDNADNCAEGAVCVQDFYRVLEPGGIAKKVEYCCVHLERAAAVATAMGESARDGSLSVVATGRSLSTLAARDGEFQPLGRLYLNFLSAANFWRMDCWPEEIARIVNPAVTAFLCQNHAIGDEGIDKPGQTFAGDGGVGIVVCDWVGKDGDWTLVECILNVNSRLLLRQRGRGL